MLFLNLSTPPHSMASVPPPSHSSCTQFSLPSRIECRQVTPCRVSGQKIAANPQQAKIRLGCCRFSSGCPMMSIRRMTTWPTCPSTASPRASSAVTKQGYVPCSRPGMSMNRDTSPVHAKPVATWGRRAGTARGRCGVAPRARHPKSGAGTRREQEATPRCCPRPRARGC